MVARTPFREGDARHADRGFDVGISPRVLDLQAEQEFAITWNSCIASCAIVVRVG